MGPKALKNKAARPYEKGPWALILSVILVKLLGL